MNRRIDTDILVDTGIFVDGQASRLKTNRIIDENTKQNSQHLMVYHGNTRTYECVF